MTSERMIMVPDWLVEEAASLIEQAGLSGTGVSLAAPRLRAALAQPAAVEPEQQAAINTDDLPTKKYPLGAFDFDAPVAAGEPVAWKRPGGNSVICDALKKSPGPEWQTIAESHTVPLYTAPPAAAHGDEAVRKDAERLDFILTKCRKVVVEMLPRGRDVYVEEGVMGERTYPAVHRDKDWPAGSAEDFAIKRQAIDAAMRAQAGEGESA